MKTERTMTELIAAIRGGDQDAFTELYNRTSQEVYRTARAVLRDEDEALDVQQDTFVFAYQHLDQLKDPEKLRPWLRTIAVNNARMLLRRNMPVLFTELENDDGQGLPEQADLSAEASPELTLERKETGELVNEILSELSDGQRAAVAMYYYEQMSASEIAEALGVNVSTVRAQLFRGRKKIEEAVRALEKKGVKLYGLSPVGFLVALMKRQAPTAQAGQAVLAKTLAKAGLAAGAKTAAAVGAGAAAVPVGEAVVLHATRPFFTTVVGKVVLGVLCVGVIGGGILGYNWAKDKLSSKSSPILNVETAENLNTTMPTIPMVVETTAPAVPETAEPAFTEAPATQDAAPNQCGENLTWSVNYGSLVIEGSGAMYDYDETNRAPWYERRGEIQSLELQGELTTIGSYAFCDCMALAGVSAAPGYGNNEYGIIHGITSIGPCAFKGCSMLELLVCSEDLNSVAASAFEGCTALRELWILNKDCAIDAKLDAPDGLTICGFPGSTAELFAQENGYSFDPIVDNRDAIIEEIKQHDSSYVNYDGEVIYQDYFLHHSVVLRVGTQYLTQILRSEYYLATEEEIQQARQTGRIVLQGAEYAYTESEEQVKKRIDYNDSEEWRDRWERYFAADAWILGDDQYPIYRVQDKDSGYAFKYTVDRRSNDCYIWNYTPIGWLLLDDDSIASQNGEPITIAEYSRTSGGGVFPNQFEVTGDDEIRLLCLSAGKK